MDGGTSSASNDSNNGGFVQNLNYYNENLFFTTNGKLDSFFANEKLRKNGENDKFRVKEGCFKKDDYSSIVANKTKPDCVKRGLVYADDGYGKKVEESAENRKNQIDFYNRKNAMENNIVHLLNADAYRKKTMGFSQEQVSSGNFY